MNPFLKRVNEPGSRFGDGLSETHDLFIEVAGKPIPTAHSRVEEAIRTVMLDTVRVHEAWLSELQLRDILSGATNSQARDEVFRANRESEARRIEGNDLLRQTNSLLADGCGLPPLEIYSP